MKYEWDFVEVQFPPICQVTNSRNSTKKEYFPAEETCDLYLILIIV